METRVHRARVRSILLVAVMVLFGLQTLRVALPLLTRYLGDARHAGGAISAFLFGTAAAVLLAPLLRRLLGEAGSLALAGSGLALARLGLQVVRAPADDLWLSAASLVFWGWFLVVWHASERNDLRRQGAPVLAVAFPLAVLLDAASRSLLLSYDLAWRQEMWATAVVTGVVVLALALLAGEVAARPARQATHEASLFQLIPLVGIGQFAALTGALLYNPVLLAQATGGSDAGAYTMAAGLAALGALVTVGVASWPACHRRHWALLDGLLLAGALLPLIEGAGPGLLWSGLASVTAGGAVGWVLVGTARAEPAHRGLHRTAAAVAAMAWLTLVGFLGPARYGPLGLVVPASVLLVLAAVWAVPGPSDPDGATLRRDTLLVGGAGVAALLSVGLWMLAVGPPRAEAPGLTAAPLRILAYNINQGLDRDARVDLEGLADVMAAQQPDLVALTEVSRARADDGFVDTLPFLSARLGMPYVFDAIPAESQVGIAVLSRFPILEWEAALYRYTVGSARGYVRVEVDAPGGRVMVYATHLDPVGGPEGARPEQVADLRSVWDGTPRSVVLGTLNVVQDAPELQPLLAAGFVDALAAAGPPGGGSTELPERILVTPDLPVDAAWAVESRASEHRPVVAAVGP